MKYFYGIDPGKKGGIGCIDADGDLVAAFPLPVRGDGWVDIREARRVLLHQRPNEGSHYALERPEMRRGQGMASTARSHADWGKLCGLLELEVDLEHRHFPVSQAWKAILSGKRDKAAAIALVQELHPDFNLVLPGCRVPHDGIADAICIAHWCRRVHGL